MSDHSHSDRAGYASASFRPSSTGPDDINRTLQAAEALFAPKRPIEDSIAEDAAGSAQQDARKPRVLSAVPVTQRAIPSADVEAIKPHKLPRPLKRVWAAHLSRIQSWLKYGMTVRQAADVYGVSVSEIERLLQKA